MFSISSLLAVILLCLPALSTATDQNLSLISLNANRLFDDRDDGYREKVLSAPAYAGRLRALHAALRQIAPGPDIIALQEIENRRVLEDLGRLFGADGQSYRSVFIAGNDFSRINLGFLVSGRLPLTATRLWFAGQLIAPDGHKLFSRPPLEIRVCPGPCINVVNLHLRSMRGLNDPRKRAKVADKRRRQAELIARRVQQRLDETENENLLLVGDFNALPASDPHVDVFGTIRGNPDPTRPRWKSADLVDPDLVDLTRKIPEAKRYSFVYRGRKQQLDHALANPALATRLTKAALVPVDRSVSDHSALHIELTF